MRRLPRHRARAATVAALVASAALSALLAVPPAAARECGDADGDGAITVADGVTVLRAAAELPSACLPGSCDLDGSRTLTVNDGVNVLRHAAGLDAPVACPRLAFVAPPVETVGEVQRGTLSALAIAPDDAHLYVAMETHPLLDPGVMTLARDATTGALRYVGFTSALAERDSIYTAMGLAVSPDGTHVYELRHEISSPYRDAVVVFRRDLATGALTLAQTLLDPLAGDAGLWPPKGIAVSPDGDDVYVVAGARVGVPGDSLLHYRRDRASGNLVYRAALFDGELGVRGLGSTADVAVSPDGRNVYVAGASDPFAPRATLVVFTRDPDSGALSHLETEYRDGRTFEGPILSPDGTSLYATLHGAPEAAVQIAIFGRGAQGGVALRGLERSFRAANSRNVSGIPGALTLDPDGTRLYLVAGVAGGGTIAVFDRRSDGDLDLREELQDGSDSITGLTAPRDVVVSHDGASLYATGLVFSDFHASVVSFELVP